MLENNIYLSQVDIEREQMTFQVSLGEKLVRFYCNVESKAPADHDNWLVPMEGIWLVGIEVVNPQNQKDTTKIDIRQGTFCSVERKICSEYMDQAQTVYDYFTANLLNPAVQSRLQVVAAQ